MSGGGHDILVVDDQPANLAVLTALLTEHGFHVRAVTSGPRALEAAAGARPASLDEPFGEDGDVELADRVAYEEDGFDLVERREAVARGLATLTPREHQVLYMRFFEDKTQSQIAKRIGVSQMHVSRILRRAVERAQPATQPPDSD